MFKNYFKVAWRNLIKHKVYNLIDIGGLAVGIASCLMIALYVHHERSYDTWMDDFDRIYRVPMEISSEGNIRRFSVVSAPIAPALQKDYPQVESTLRLWLRPTRLVRLANGQMFYEDYIYYAEPSFFEFFTLRMPEGSPSVALSRPNSVVISETAAKRYFGSRPASGQTLSINDTEFEVTGVMEDTPENTHHNFNLLMSWATLGDWSELENWHSTSFFTYVKLLPGVDVGAFGESISNLAYRYVADDLERFKQSYRYDLQPVADIHLYSDYVYEAKPTGSAATVYILAIIAGVVLLIACLNFVNLSTARSEIRAKEVGMRKVVGARRKSLIAQFLGEAIMLSFVAMLAALLILDIALPWYNRMVGIEFGMEILKNPKIIATLLLVTLAIGFGAGFYPALILSSFKPINIFRPRNTNSHRGTMLRKVLVVSQFAITVILIAGTVTLFKQLDFMMHKELGFQTDQMLVLPIRGAIELEEKYGAVKSGFGDLASVEGVTLSSSVPGRGTSNYAIRIDREDNDMIQSMYHLFVDYDFAETYELEIITGRDFDPGYGKDKGETFLISEAAVKSFGWSSPDEAIGKILQSGAGGFKAEIVGVFKNFHYRSVDHVVEPLVLNIRDNFISTITLRLRTGDVSGTMAQIRAEWNILFPDKPFDYFFLDEAFNAQYAGYERTGNILLTFSILAIVIACLGLYGLAAFSTQQRTKEIGVRKVLGASAAGITALLTKDFLKLVIVGFVIATPIAWYAMNRWLEDFAYRIDIGWWVFALAGGLALLIALLTVSVQAVRAALANPVEALRYE